MSRGEEKAKQTWPQRAVPIVSAVGLAVIAVRVTFQLGPIIATNPLTSWVAAPLIAILFGAFGYWFGKCQNLDDAIRKLPAMLIGLIPRFSVRTLAIVVTLVCVYLGAWEATKRYGLTNERHEMSPLPVREMSPLPLIIIQTGWFEGPRTTLYDPYGEWSHRRRFYLWLFGPKIKLPFEW